MMTRPRTRQSDNQNKCTWLGILRKCTKVNPFTMQCRTYAGVQFNNLTLNVGDFVLISNVDADEPETTEGCDVARIEHLFESTKQGDKYRANVQWYSKPSKLPRSIDSDHMDHTHEIVEDFRKFNNNVSVETIYKKCSVINAYEDDIPEDVRLKNKVGFNAVFVCRYRLCCRRSKFHVEPVLKLDDMLNSDESNSCSANNDTNKNASRYMPNAIIDDEPKDSLRRKSARHRGETVEQKNNLSTPKSKNFNSGNTPRSRSTSRLRSALWECSIDSESENLRTLSPIRGAAAFNRDSDFENSPKSTPRKNPKSSQGNQTPLKSNRSNTMEIKKHGSQSIAKNPIAKIPNNPNDMVPSTPTKTELGNSTRKRKAQLHFRSSSEESLEPRSRSISPEIDCIGPPAAYKLYETNGQTLIIKKQIDIEHKVSKKLNDSTISDLLSADESDSDTFWEELKKSGTKIVARSKSDDNGFELLTTPKKNEKLLRNISENGESKTPNSTRRNLSESLDVRGNRDACKDLLLKKMADKREDASLRIKLRRSSEQSSYKIDSDSDSSVNNKSRRRNVLGTPKSILKVNSKGPATPSVQFNNLDEINEYSPTTEIGEKLLKVEIKLKRLDTDEVRKSSRNKKVNSRYSDYYEIVSSPITEEESPKKRMRNTINYNEKEGDEELMPRSSRRTRRSTSTTNYLETTNLELTEKPSSNVTTRKAVVKNKLECSNNEADESDNEIFPNTTLRKTRYSRNNSAKDSNEILNDQLKSPIGNSEMKQKDSDKMTKNSVEGLEVVNRTPKRNKRTVNIDIVSTPSRTSAKVDYEQIEPVTPKRSVPASKLQTPSKSVKNGLLTPSMRQRNICISKPSTPLQHARARLHVSAVPKSLPCREEEFNNIYTFLEGKLMDNSGGCLYISGVPGTGKTATVNEVIRCLKKSVSKGKIDNFDFLEINGMKLTEPRQAYVEILKQLTGKKATWEQAHQLLDKRFTKAAPSRLMTLLLVDELDILCNKRQDVVYNLLDWPAKSSAHLVVITIANTMDLPERVLMGRVTSRLGLTRLTFQPYTHKQLQEIVTARLKDSHAFKSEAIQLVARKVAAVSGDARRALDICRRATEVAEVNNSEIVSMQDVNEALTEMIASAKVQAIRHCSEMERAFLQAVCSEVARTGVEEVSFNNIYIQLTSLCSLEGLRVPSVTEAITICAKLGSSRLLICEHSRTDIHQRVLLNVSSDDVHFSMQNIEV